MHDIWPNYIAENLVKQLFFKKIIVIDLVSLNDRKKINEGL